MTEEQELQSFVNRILKQRESRKLKKKKLNLMSMIKKELIKKSENHSQSWW